ncbi:MAG: hypothetical protein LQ345_005676 [Seirophora villosa]|nr:MAG: hypothetical protein LQ345_005676 [Seirophora villosa]
MSTSPTPLPPLTLIVASTPTLGIGLNGSLAWPPLKPDLQFFARVTKRPPPDHHHPQQASSPDHEKKSTPPRTRNAVIMGRKTYDSIPAKFRPLKDRHNLIITRSPSQFAGQAQPEESGSVVAASSIASALQTLRSRHGGAELGRVFVIGGAEIYRQALRLAQCERVLWTRLSGEWECDTWFPEGVVADEVEEGGEGKNGWRRRTRTEMEEWVGQEGVGGLRKDGETEFEVSMWERGREGD